uniref:Putative secreted protein n=1 Tax=Anopheles darlingi TaxID=43151 RepID=A0A2M4DAM5_ANODA
MYFAFLFTCLTLVGRTSLDNRGQPLLVFTKTMSLILRKAPIRLITRIANLNVYAFIGCWHARHALPSADNKKMIQKSREYYGMMITHHVLHSLLPGNWP